MGDCQGGSPPLCLYAPLTQIFFVMPIETNKSTGTVKYNTGSYSDEEYLKQIEQYKGNSWYNRLLENPWMRSKQAEFSPSFWQDLGETLFQDYSARDSYWAGLQSNQNQWLSDMLQQLHQQDYDSPAEQVSREKQAGLNPDLAPGSISPGSAAENDQPISPVAFPQGSDSGDVVQTIGSTAMSFCSNLIGMAQSFQSLKLGNLELAGKEIENNSSARDFVLNQIAGTGFFNSENDLDNMTPGDLANNIIAASSKIDYSTYSPKVRKLMKSMFNRYAKDVTSGRSPMAVESLKSELRNRISTNNRSAAGIAGSPVFDEDFNTMIRKIAVSVGKAEYNAQMAEYGARLSKAGYDSKYFHNLNPESAAAGDNAENEAKKVTQSQTAIIEGMWNDIYKICKESDSWYGTIGLVLIPFLRSMVSNMSVAAGRYGKSGKFGFTGINF